MGHPVLPTSRDENVIKKQALNQKEVKEEDDDVPEQSFYNKMIA